MPSPQPAAAVTISALITVSTSTVRSTTAAALVSLHRQLVDCLVTAPLGLCGCDASGAAVVASLRTDYCCYGIVKGLSYC